MISHEAGPTASELGPQPEDDLEPLDRPSVQFVVELASALSRAGAAPGVVQPRAARIAHLYGVPEARIVVLPNLTLAGAGRGTPVEVDSESTVDEDLRLDQMAAIERLARRADVHGVAPEEGLRELDRVMTLPHRFGAAGVIAGHAIVSLGLCLLLQPTPVVLLMSAGLGLMVGILKLGARRVPSIAVLLPILAAVLVSAISFWVAPDRTAQESVRALIPPLVTFLPGAAIATATLDLAAGHLISGSSRLVAGTMQLFLLALGIGIGATLAGVQLNVATANLPANTLGSWSPWLGAVVFGAGCFLMLSGPPRSLLWLLVVLLSAYLGERLGGRLLSPELGAFTGALLVTPVAAWVELRPTGTPSLATMMPAFWLLVPGAAGLIGVTKFVGSGQHGEASHFVDTLVTFVLIGLGIFLGNALVLGFRSRRTRRGQRA